LPISLGAPVLITPVIRKLQIDAEILLLDHGNDFLQSVAIFPADAYDIGLDGGLRFFLEFLTSFTISLAFSIGMPCCRVIFCFTVLPAEGSSGP